MSRLFAYRATAAGIARRAQQRQAAPAIMEPAEPERALAGSPVPRNNVVQMNIPRTSMQQLIADTAHKHGLTYADMTGRSRSRKIVAARHEAIAAVKHARPCMSLQQIGRLFNRDFSTVAHALRKMGMA